MKRLFPAALVVALATAGCAEKSTTANDNAVAETIEVVDSAAATTLDTTDSGGDFGSRYVGSPVAFWFWAPY